MSKDEDFASLRTLRPEGPQVVWVRLGNTTRRTLLGWFETLLPEIERQLRTGEMLIEIAPGDGTDSQGP